jgi:hypothetical protein
LIRATKTPDPLLRPKLIVCVSRAALGTDFFAAPEIISALDTSSLLEARNLPSFQKDSQAESDSHGDYHNK